MSTKLAVPLAFVLLLLYIYRSPDQSCAIGNKPIVSEYCTAPCYGTITKVDQCTRSIYINVGLTDVLFRYAPCTGKIVTNTGNQITLDTQFGDIMLKQSSKFDAKGAIRRGDNLGCAKFGLTTVTLTLPQTSQILVWPGDRVYGPNTIIAHIPF